MTNTQLAARRSVLFAEAPEVVNLLDCGACGAVLGDDAVRFSRGNGVCRDKDGCIEREFRGAAS